MKDFLLAYFSIGISLGLYTILFWFLSTRYLRSVIKQFSITIFATFYILPIFFIPLYFLTIIIEYLSLSIFQFLLIAVIVVILFWIISTEGGIVWKIIYIPFVLWIPFSSLIYFLKKELESAKKESNKSYYLLQSQKLGKVVGELYRTFHEEIKVSLGGGFYLGIFIFFLLSNIWELWPFNDFYESKLIFTTYPSHKKYIIFTVCFLFFMGLYFYSYKKRLKNIYEDTIFVMKVAEIQDTYILMKGEGQFLETSLDDDELADIKSKPAGATTFFEIDDEWYLFLDCRINFEDFQIMMKLVDKWSIKEIAEKIQV